MSFVIGAFVISFVSHTIGFLIARWCYKGQINEQRDLILALQKEVKPNTVVNTKEKIEMWIMQRKKDGRYFVRRNLSTSSGDLMTGDPNKAALYNTETPAGFVIDLPKWKAVEVNVQVTLKGD